MSRLNEAAGFTRRKLEPEMLKEFLKKSFNEAAGFTRRKRKLRPRGTAGQGAASMRPPDLPGGNSALIIVSYDCFEASMRPPDLPGGNVRGADR